MSEREKIIRYYRASGDAELAAKLIDLADNSLRSRKYRVSEFLDPYGYSVAETIVAHYPGLSLQGEGGYSGAERVRVVFIEPDFPGKIDFSITALSVTWDGRHHQLGHRDILGALMSLGVKRELFGDIILVGDSCQIIADTTIANYIMQNLLKIASASVQVQVIELSAVQPREEKMKEIRSTVASLRLDTVAAVGFGTSRTKMTSEIEADKVKVNWQQAKSASQAVKTGDIISMRGRGRVEVCEIIGQTRKGRISLVLRRFV